MHTHSRCKRALKCALCALLACSMLLGGELLTGAQTTLNLEFGEGDVHNEGESVFLSDYLSDSNVAVTRNSGYGQIFADKTADNKSLSMRVEGQTLTFEKGIWAHASSTLIFDLSKIPGNDERGDMQKRKYTKLCAFVGLNTSAGGNGNGVKFTISVSDTNQSGSNGWTKIYDPDRVFFGNTDGVRVKLDLQGKRYLKLEASDNGGNGSDHSIYGDAMLLSDKYEDPFKGPTVEEMDTTIRAMASSSYNQSPANYSENLKLAILQRDFISSFGEYTMAKYMVGLATADDKEAGQKVRDFVQTVLLQNDHKLLEEFVFGGAPWGGYANAVNVLAELYEAHSADLDDDQHGALYTRMMVAIALIHSKGARLFILDRDDKGTPLDLLDPESPNVSKPVKRYEVLKELFLQGKLEPFFEKLETPLLCHVVDACMGDDDVEWTNGWFTEKRRTNAKQEYDPHWIRYSLSYNYAADRFFTNEETRKQYQTTYGVSDDLMERMTVDGGAKRYPAMWVLLAECGVCVQQAYFGKNCYNSVGRPAMHVGQPGHAALMMMYWDEEHGKIASWKLVNGSWPWIQSSFGATGEVYAHIGSPPPILGWGRGSYAYSASLAYTWLASRAVNDFANYKDAEYAVKLANSFPGDENDHYNIRCELYNQALAVESFNFDAMLALTKEYREKGDTSSLLEHAKKIYNEYGKRNDFGKMDLLPLYDLFRMILPVFGKDAGSLIELAKLQNSAFTVARQSGDDDLYFIAKFLQGNASSTDVATFSFDGEHPGEVSLGSMFTEENAPGWEIQYRYKFGPEWKVNTIKVPEGQLSYQLSSEEYNRLYEAATNTDTITFGYDLNIVFDGVSTPFTIKIQNSQDLPFGIAQNDLEDTIYGYDDYTMWYKRDEVNHPWTPYVGHEDAYKEAQQRRQVQVRTTDGGPPDQVNGTNVEWRDICNDRWTPFCEELPPTEGTTEFTYMRSPTGTQVFCGSKVMRFTPDATPDTRKYISVKGVSLVDYSSETSAHPARNLLDGNNQCVQVGTLSHYYDSSWSTSDTDQKYVIFKLDNPAVLTAVDYIPAVQGIGWAHDNIANGALYSGDLYTSEDGVAWDLVSSLDGLQYSSLSSNNVKKTFEIPEDKQKLVSYVKVVARETYYSTYVNLTEPAGHHHDENQVFSARAFEFYQDSTKNSVLTGVVSYSEENPTNQSVTARVGNLSTQNAEVIGEDTVTFEENGSHTFTFEEKDAEGKVVKTGTATAVVDWIDKEEPKAHIEYSTTSPTGGLVLATLSVDEKGSEKSTLELYTTKGEWTPLTEIDEDLALPPGDRRKKFQVSPYEATFNENGTYSFALRDKAGNSRTYEARVNWILTSAPETVVTYSTTSPTGKSVTATLSCPSGKISPVEGGSLTHIFTANGDYEFRYLDAAGNEWTAAASVDWIDLEPPAAHVEYSPARVKGKETRGPVTATLVLDSAEEVTVLGDGQMSHTFNRNGVHLFRLRDGAGNVTTVKAEVTWIGGAS